MGFEDCKKWVYPAIAAIKLASIAITSKDAITTATAFCVFFDRNITISSISKI